MGARRRSQLPSRPREAGAAPERGRRPSPLEGARVPPRGGRRRSGRAGQVPSSRLRAARGSRMARPAPRPPERAPSCPCFPSLGPLPGVQAPRLGAAVEHRGACASVSHSSPVQGPLWTGELLGEKEKSGCGPPKCWAGLRAVGSSFAQHRASMGIRASKEQKNGKAVRSPVQPVWPGPALPSGRRGASGGRRPRGGASTPGRLPGDSARGTKPEGGAPGPSEGRWWPSSRGRGQRGAHRAAPTPGSHAGGSFGGAAGPWLGGDLPGAAR